MLRSLVGSEMCIRDSTTIDQDRFKRTMTLLEPASSSSSSSPPCNYSSSLVLPATSIAATLSWLLSYDGGNTENGEGDDNNNSFSQNCRKVVDIYASACVAQGGVMSAPEATFNTTLASTHLLRLFSRSLNACHDNCIQPLIPINNNNITENKQIMELFISTQKIISTVIPRGFMFQATFSVFDAVPVTNVSGVVDTAVAVLQLLGALEASISTMQHIVSETVQIGRTNKHSTHTRPNEQLQRRQNQEEDVSGDQVIDQAAAAKLRSQLQRLITQATAQSVHISALLLKEFDGRFNKVAFSLLQDRLCEIEPSTIPSSSSLSQSLVSFLQASVPRLVKSRFVSPPPYVLQTGAFKELYSPTTTSTSTLAENTTLSSSSPRKMMKKGHSGSADIAIDTFTTACHVMQHLISSIKEREQLHHLPTSTSSNTTNTTTITTLDTCLLYTSPSPRDS
eukprot:TRINITY_DN8908_c0_g1_i5.p1 TRINITY_DN8908_c0_g1~~TRINITY_DN8908_c0_g1_i5.p1  ORF type:complete len:452 (-),score=89.16 TRINITY_DN8908_c0_g1_i5:155-1510(-)